MVATFSSFHSSMPLKLSIQQRIDYKKTKKEKKGKEGMHGRKFRKKTKTKTLFDSKILFSLSISHHRPKISMHSLTHSLCLVMHFSTTFFLCIFFDHPLNLGLEPHQHRSKHHVLPSFPCNLQTPDSKSLSLFLPTFFLPHIVLIE